MLEVSVELWSVYVVIHPFLVNLTPDKKSLLKCKILNIYLNVRQCFGIVLADVKISIDFCITN